MTRVHLQMKNDGRSERALCARDRRNHSNKRLLAIRNIGRIKDGGASHPTTSCSNTLSRFRLEEIPRTSLTHTLRATLCVLFGLFKLLFGAVLNRSVIEPRMCPGKPWMYLYVVLPRVSRRKWGCTIVLVTEQITM